MTAHWRPRKVMFPQVEHYIMTLDPPGLSGDASVLITYEGLYGSRYIGRRIKEIIKTHHPVEYAIGDLLGVFGGDRDV